MAKIDKSQYSKEEWRRIKEQRRVEKQEKMVINSLSSSVPSPQNKYYVLCLKHGTKYSADYVNRLYNMVKRHCTLDYEFVCLTDDPKDINENVKIITLPGGLSGWWYKPYMFSQDLPISGIVLYMDLDVVIGSNIDKLFTWEPNHWCIIRDFTRAMRPKWHKYNSSVIRFRTGELNHIWEEFEKDKINIQKRLHGDQDWIFEATHNRKGAMLYPDSWILSWKWEVRKSKEFTPGGLKGYKTLKVVENVRPRVECCVCVFHGDPQPHNCLDPWVIDNWK